jgi:hypothetical protein
MTMDLKALTGKRKLKWESEEVQDAMAAYYIPSTESIWGKKEFDNAKLKYHYETFDYDQMARQSVPGQSQSRLNYFG